MAGGMREMKDLRDDRGARSGASDGDVVPAEEFWGDGLVALGGVAGTVCDYGLRCGSREEDEDKAEDKTRET